MDQQLLLLFLQAMVALQGLLLCLPFSLASTTINHASSDNTNLIQNGSFEEGHFNLSSSGHDEIFNEWTPKDDYIAGWVRTSGEVEIGQGQRKRASDCSNTSLDLNGGFPGNLTNSFKPGSASSNLTVLLDAAANPGASPPINGSFTVAVLSAQNITIHSSLFNVDGHGHDAENIGWHTLGFRFTVMPSDLQGNLTLFLSSHIQ
eukprot:c25143_g2_i2 orf=55-666(+)